MDRPLYFDYASTTPVDPLVAEAMRPYFSERFGNPSSPHAFGREALKALEDARKTVADILGADPSEILFTSGATEANNQVVHSAARSRGGHAVASALEHHSVLEPLEDARSQGLKVTHLPVDQDGLVNPRDLLQAITPETSLVCVMHANNEIGTLQPVEEIARITRERGIGLLVDAVQTVGHVLVQVSTLGADFLTLSAHKFYGPKGIGALYVRKGQTLWPLLRGGDQESRRRASTQNVASAVGLARALELCRERMADEAVQQTQLRDALIAAVRARIPEAVLNGHPRQRLPNNVHFSFPSVQGEALLMALDMAGLCASMGSACTSGAMKVSHVLRAIGQPDDLAYGALRVTLGRWTTRAHVEALAEALGPALEQVRC